MPLKALLPLFWEIFPLFFFLFKGMAFWEQLCYSPSDETLSPWKVYRTEKLNSIVWKQGELSTMQKWRSQLEYRVSRFREVYSILGEIIFFAWYQYRDHEGLQKLPISKLWLVRRFQMIIRHLSRFFIYCLKVGWFRNVFLVSSISSKKWIKTSQPEVS